jgi:hypothetical protein
MSKHCCKRCPHHGGDGCDPGIMYIWNYKKMKLSIDFAKPDEMKSLDFNYYDYLKAMH